jgi:hypothetical protein
LEVTFLEPSHFLTKTTDCGGERVSKENPKDTEEGN